jgi:antitoxin component YwqK of YwqJK toxin-antitoxin module
MQGMSIYKLDDVPFTGRCEKFYENSNQLYMESSYKKGILDGYTIYYNRDGSTILMEKYELGVMTSTVH